MAIESSAPSTPSHQDIALIHDGAWKAQVGVGLAKYQRSVVGILDVLDRGHEQVAGLTRASGAAVKQIGTLLISPKRLKLLVRRVMPHHGLETVRGVIFVCVAIS